MLFAHAEQPDPPVCANMRAKTARDPPLIGAASVRSITAVVEAGTCATEQASMRAANSSSVPSTAKITRLTSA